MSVPSMPTLNKSSTTIGGRIRIYTNRDSSRYDHHLYYTIEDGPMIGITSGITDDYEWTVPTSVYDSVSNGKSVWMQFVLITFDGNTNMGWNSIGFTAYVPSTSPAIPIEAAVGSTINISTSSRISSNITHKLTYSFEGLSGTIATNVGDGTTFAIPMSWANQIPNSVRGTLYVGCTTYNSGIEIGTRTSVMMITIPSSVVPTISSIGTSDPTGLLSTYGAYVQGKSTCRINANVSGAYSSTITSISITANGSTYTANGCTTGVLLTTGTNTISVKITDSRGRTASSSTTISVLAYANPTISAFSVIRCNASGTADESGAYMKAVFKASITALNNHNGKTITLQYKKKSDSAWTTAETYSSYSVDTSKVIAADTDKTYDVKLSAADNFTTAIRTSDLGTVFTLMDFLADGKGIAFGKVAETTNLFDCNLPAKFQSTLTTSDAIKTVYDKAAIYFRGLSNATYEGWVAYESAGNEALVFGTDYGVTSFIFANGLSHSGIESKQWQSCTPALQIKSNCIAVNKLIGNGVTPSYTADINGSLNATTIYENGTSLASKYLGINASAVHCSQTGGYSGNECSLGELAKASSSLWINYRPTKDGSTSDSSYTKLAAYYFGNRKGTYSGVTLYASSFAGNAATATQLATARNITVGNKTNSFNGTSAISFGLNDANMGCCYRQRISSKSVSVNLASYLGDMSGATSGVFFVMARSWCTYPNAVGCWLVSYITNTYSDYWTVYNAGNAPSMSISGTTITVTFLDTNGGMLTILH